MNPVDRDKQTGISTPGCYAASLKDCRGPLTREHFISDSVLLQIGPKFRVIGDSHIAPSLPLTTNALTCNMLCERHNGLLSCVDDAANKLFSMLLAFRHNHAKGHLKLNGEDIERWMLKVLYGILYSGRLMPITGVSLKGKAPPVRSLELLFGPGRMPADFGLHCFENLDSFRSEEIAVRAYAEIDNSVVVKGQIIGMEAKLMGVSFNLCQRSEQILIVGKPIRSWFRPRLLRLGKSAAIEFTWPNQTLTQELLLSKRSRCEARYTD